MRLRLDPDSVVGMKLSGQDSDRVERYLCVTVEVTGGSVLAKLQRPIGEPVAVLCREFRRMIEEECLILNGDGLTDEASRRIADSLEVRLMRTWPQRLWSLEFWNGHDLMMQSRMP